MIGEFRNKYPHYNFVICHTSHRTDFKGVRGKDWGHSHQELPVSFHKTVGLVFILNQKSIPVSIIHLSFRFEIYWFKKGTFHRQGDGGWLNVCTIITFFFLLIIMK